MRSRLLFLSLLIGFLALPSISQAKKARLKLPVCGTLIDNLFMMPAEEAKRLGVSSERLTFLVPIRTGKPDVLRYAVITRKGNFEVPLDTYTPWWVCVKTGEVLKEYTFETHEHGTLRIDSFEIDQTAVERGQE
jgi:hypothetical protein